MTDELFGPEWEPPLADYLSFLDQVNGAFIMLGAFGVVGVGAFFALGGASSITAAIADGGVVVNGVTYYGVSAEDAVLLASITEEALSAEEAEVLARVGQLGHPPLLDAAGVRNAWEWDPYGDDYLLMQEILRAGQGGIASPWRFKEEFAVLYE